MRHRIIPSSDGYRRYSFVEVFRFSDLNFTCTITNPNDQYLALAINYCTASGTTTVTDSVSPDQPTITIGGVSVSSIYSIRLLDNTGDEGTGFAISAFPIPSGTTSFVSNGQSAEDKYATYIFLFKDGGPGANSGSFLVFPPAIFASGPSPDVPTVSVANSDFSYWGAHANNTAQMSSSYADWGMDTFSTTANIVLCFYHSYGGGAPLTPVFQMTNPVTNPVYTYSGGDNGFALEGQTAVYVYNGVDVGRQSSLLFTPQTNASQGDQMIVLQF